MTRESLMTGFVDRIYPASQSADRNRKLPTWQESIKTIPSDAVFARWRRRALRRISLLVLSAKDQIRKNKDQTLYLIVRVMPLYVK